MDLSNKSNYDLRQLIRFTDYKQQAAAILRQNIGAQLVDEEILIKQIAGQVINRPESLKMDEWHFGTSHCLAGWACVLNPIAKDIEEKYDTEIAGCAVLPNYAHLFFSDNDT